MTADRRSFLAVSGLGAIAGRVPRPSAASMSPGPSLALTPQVTEGPFYLALGLPRSDITEGRPGVPLDVRIRVVDVRGQPLVGAQVDLWHCDASGFYSGFDGQGAGRDPKRAVTMRGRTFLRGTLHGGDDGVVTFRTIYPGWYAGRTTHIHLKVFRDDHVILTSQIFLPDALSEYLFTSVADYRRATLRDTLNRRDGIALEAGDAAFGDVREEGDRYVVTATTVVDPDARPPAERPPRPPGRRPDGPPDSAGLRPRFDVGNAGGGVRGSLGVSGGSGRGGPRGPGNGPPPDGPPPMGEGPPHEVLQGDARVAAIVPGSTTR